MKPVATLTTLAALVAFVFVEFSFVTSVSVLFTLGLSALMVADYSRVVRPIALPARAGSVAAPHPERLGLAA